MVQYTRAHTQVQICFRKALAEFVKEV